MRLECVSRFFEAAAPQKRGINRLQQAGG